MAVAAVGLWQARQVMKSENARLSEILLMQTASIAQSIIPDRVSSLTFTGQDQAGAYFKRLNREFSIAAESLGLGGVYTVAYRDGAYRFGPVSFAPGHPLYSPPGTPYRQPPPALKLAFESVRPQVTPYYTDEFGDAISAYVPVVAPLTGEVVMVVGADLHLPSWRGARARIGTIPLGFAAVIMLLLLAGCAALHRRPPLSETSPWWHRHAEAMWSASVFLTLTAAIAWRVQFAESQDRQAAFRTLAQQQTLAVARELWSIRSSLEGLSRFFHSHHHLSRSAFTAYASRFLEDLAIQAALWLPVVPSNAVAAVEAVAAAEGLSDYHVWQGDPAGHRLPVAGRDTYYPTHYIEPFASHAIAAGFDHGSEPVRARALHAALETGLQCASGPVALFAVTNRPPGFFVYQATASQTQTGVVAFAINIDAVVRVPMNRVVSLPGELLTLDLYNLTSGHTAVPHASSPPLFTSSGTAQHARQNAGSLRMTLPMFAFGETYALDLYASPDWLAVNPLRQGRYAALGGVSVTALLTFLIGILRQRRNYLEQKIRAHTAELRVVNDKLTGILNASPVAMLLVDRDAHVLDANLCSERLLRRGFFEYRFEPCGVFLRCVNRRENGCGRGPACPNCMLRNTVRAVADSGTPVFDRNIEILLESEGQTETFHLIFGASPIKVGHVNHVVVALYDITMWHRAEQLYSTLFHAMQYGLVLLRPISRKPGAPIDFVVKAANPAVQTLIGIAPATLPGKTMRSVLSDIPEHIFKLFANTLENAEDAIFSAYLPSLDKHFEGTAFRPMPGQIAVIFTDVTARTRAEEQARAAATETVRLLKKTEESRLALLTANTELKKAEEALRYERNLLYALMDNQPDRIFFKDAEGRYIKISKQETQVLGLASPAEAIGKTLADFRPGEATQRIMETDREIIRTGRPVLAQIQERLGSDGTTVWESVSKAPIRNHEDQNVGIVGIIRDITSLIEMQQHLQYVSKMDAVGRLAGGVAHDFNNLLQAILGFTELLLADTPEQSPQYGDLKQIERAAGRAVGLTRQLLTFSRKQRINLQTLDINHAIHATEKLLRRLLGENVTLTLKLSSATGTVLADAAQLEQVLMNLAVNAKDAMPEGGHLKISTEPVTLLEEDTVRIPESYAGEFVCITVSDTGCGIPPEIMHHLFEPFFTTKERGKGTGLGLSVIYGIVKQCRGWINVYTASGKGTTFKIYLPVSAQETETDTSTTDPASSNSIEVSALRGDGKTLLLVEDEPGVRNLAEAMLKKAGYAVFSCANAAEALACFDQNGDHIDLLFSDIVMAGGNGIDLALELRKRRADLPVLLCSGYADDTVRWEAIEKKGFRFIPKPYPTVTLLQALHAELSARRSGGTG